MNGYFQSFIQVCHLAQALKQAIKIISGIAKDFFISKEGDSGAGITGFADYSYLTLRDPPFIFLLIELAVASDVNLEPERERIHH